MLTGNSYARITLALDIIKKLTEGEFAGYHELNIIKQQIDLCDTIAVEESETTKIISEDPNIPKDSDNLCWKVVDLLKSEFKIKDNVTITIKKNIPPKGGLAGGSSNAATTFLLLNKLWDLHLSQKQLISLGREIGMDIPFFLVGNTAFDTESTGVLKRIRTDLKFVFVIALPEVGVSTKEAYEGINYNYIAKNIRKTGKVMEGLERMNCTLHISLFMVGYKQ